MGPTPVRAVLPMSVSSGVPINLDSTPVQVYDYYEPGGKQQQRQYYDLPLMKSNDICTRQPNYESCPSINRRRFQLGRQASMRRLMSLYLLLNSELMQAW
ncbi:hypothetical protein BaRGS_00018879 [Batillaria attramentaria]|uniref:Uncharacterized protein n=1 Tax=Batillaria attramentaria TaxID=370345 RepID=A0ABD0KRF2_9CAEN